MTSRGGTGQVTPMHSPETGVTSSGNGPDSPASGLGSARLEIRLLESGDEAALQAVFEAAGDYFLSITGRPEPDADAAEREIRTCVSTPGRDVALVSPRGAGEPIGMLGWWRGSPEPDVALLGTLLVVPAYRGKGVAREALGALEGWLAGQGIRRLRTGVGAGDERVHALLRALGFEPLDQRTHVSLDRGRMMIALFEKGIR